MDVKLQQQKEEALFLRRVHDLTDRAEQIGYVVFSDFLDGRQRTLLEADPAVRRVRVQYIGGYEDAERVVAAFYPSFLEPGDWDEPIRAVRIRIPAAKFLSRRLQHRDYLGALMGIGIRREKFGDILVEDTGAVVIVLEQIAEYVISTLTSVGPAEVSCSLIPLSEVASSIPDGKEIIVTVQSLRLDSLIGKGFSIARSESASLVGAGKVFVNWSEETRPDHALKEGDTVSVRGRGRLKIRKVLGLSRSGRTQVLIERFG